MSKANFEKLQQKFERNWARFQDDDDGDAGGWSPLDRWEARQAAGYEKIAGKHVPTDGLVARNGNRRILPEDDDPQTRLILAEDLKSLVPEVLHGRSATVIEALVVDPLFGRPKRSPEDLARQFGITRAQIDRIKYGAVRKLEEAAQADRMAAAEAKRKALDATARQDAKLCPRGDQCCIVLHPNGIYGDEGCQCRRPWLEVFTRDPRIEDLRHAIDAMWQHERAFPSRKKDAALELLHHHLAVLGLDHDPVAAADRVMPNCRSGCRGYIPGRRPHLRTVLLLIVLVRIV